MRLGWPWLILIKRELSDWIASDCTRALERFSAQYPCACTANRRRRPLGVHPTRRGRALPAALHYRVCD